MPERGGALSAASAAVATHNAVATTKNRVITLPPAESRSAWRFECRIGSHLHQHFSEIVPAQHFGKTCRHIFYAMADVLAIFEGSRSYQRRDRAQEFVLVVRDIIADKKIADRHLAFREDVRPSPHQGSPRIRSGRIAIVRDQATNRHPCIGIEQRQHRIEHGAADVFEIDVNAGRAGLVQILRKRRAQMRDTGIEPERPRYEAAFFVTAGDSDDARSRETRKLPGDLPYASRDRKSVV